MTTIAAEERMRQSLAFLDESLETWADMYHHELTGPEVKAWHKCFCGYRPETLSAALERVTKDAKRMPTPGHLTEAIDILRKNGELGDTRTFAEKFPLDRQDEMTPQDRKELLKEIRRVIGKEAVQAPTAMRGVSKATEPEKIAPRERQAHLRPIVGVNHEPYVAQDDDLPF